MIRILFISARYTFNSPGGSAKSFLNIYNGLKNKKGFEIELLNYGLSRSSFVKIYDFFSFLPYALNIKFLYKIKKFKPHLIISQGIISYPAIIAARINKIPIINILRDISTICPKRLDIIDYGKTCSGLENKNACYKCINLWRTLCIMIGKKPVNWQYSNKAILSTIFYKLKYFICKFNLFLINKATITLVASELMKSILIQNIDESRIKVLNITPIRRIKKKIVENKLNQILFLLSSFGVGYKGLDFVLKLVERIRDDFTIIIAGRKLSPDKIKKFETKIINYNYVKHDKLYDLYQNSKLTLVPSFWTEAFGRVIIESIINKTPIISSPNCGANYYFNDKSFVKIVPLKVDKWLKAINDSIENPPEITDKDVEEIYRNFSVEKCISQIIDLINEILK